MSNPANFVHCSLTLSHPCLVISLAVLKDFSEILLCQLPCTSIPFFASFSVLSTLCVKIHPMRSGIKLSLLSLCNSGPMAGFSYLGSLEISRRREVTPLLVPMSPQSALPAPCLPWGALGLQRRHEAAQPSWTQQGAILSKLSWSHSTAHPHAPRSSAPHMG